MGPVTEAPARLYPVRLLPDDRVFHVGAEEDILTAGLRQGVDLRYGCRHGQCTSCKYVVVEGDVVHKGASPYAFSARESEEGGVLLCSTFARSPLVISPFGEHPPADGGPIIPPEERTARVVSLAPARTISSRSASARTSRCRTAPASTSRSPCPGGERRSFSMTAPPDPPATCTFLLDAGHRRLLDALTPPPEDADRRPRPVRPVLPPARPSARSSWRPAAQASARSWPSSAELLAAGAAPPIRLYLRGPGRAMP